MLEGHRKEGVKGREEKELREEARTKRGRREGRVNDEERKRVNVTRGIGGDRKTGEGEKRRKG